VGWRAFFIGGVFYYLTDDDLFKTQPMLTITESSQGVMGIGFDYDLGKKAATVEVPSQCGLWVAPPGSVIVLQQMGPLNGRWIVNSFSRSVFSSNADISLSKPQPDLPEPLEDDLQKEPSWAAPSPGTGTAGGASGGTQSEPGEWDGRGNPKEIIDEVVVPLAVKHGMSTGTSSAAVAEANARHGPTVSGNPSDHQGPPSIRWASDMSNGISPTPQMDALARDLAATFDIPWTGSGLISKSHGIYRFQLIYRTGEGGNHYNHVHFGIRTG
jgi:hypothetical protein